MPLATHEYVIPFICLAVVAWGYFYEYYYLNAYSIKEHKSNENKSYVYFSKMRHAWVVQHHLGGGVVSNTVRDYVRATMFFAGTSISLGTFLSARAGEVMVNMEYSDEKHLLLFKLGVCVVIFMTTFFLFLSSTRYAMHLTFLLNTANVEDRPVTAVLPCAVFRKSYSYYAAGLRLYYVVILLFAWLLSVWSLLLICPLYVYLVHDYETLSFISALTSDVENVENEVYNPMVV